MDELREVLKKCHCRNADEEKRKRHGEYGASGKEEKDRLKINGMKLGKSKQNRSGRLADGLKGALLVRWRAKEEWHCRRAPRGFEAVSV